jgi:hypothetical protein
MLLNVAAQMLKSERQWQWQWLHDARIAIFLVPARSCCLFHLVAGICKQAAREREVLNGGIQAAGVLAGHAQAAERQVRGSGQQVLRLLAASQRVYIVPSVWVGQGMTETDNTS